MKTKNFLSTILVVAVVLFTACNKNTTPQDETSQEETSQRVLNIAAINSSKSQAVNVELESMEKTTFSIGCHVATSTIFDAQHKIFGYMGCDSIYHMVDIDSGVEVKQIPLPACINLVVVDTARNVLIGHYYVYDGLDGADHVLTVNLNDGSIISDKPFYVNGMWNAATCFFRDVENEYVLLSADNALVFINPYTGDTIRKLNIETAAISNGVYDGKNNRLIGVTYSGDDDVNYIVTVDLSTGKTLSKVAAQGLNSYRLFESDYDAETNSYVLVSVDNAVLFFDVATGELNDSYQLDFNLTSLQLWYNDK